MLRLIDVAKSYGGKTVVERMSLDVLEGKTTVLLGPSGSGKSTLLRIMAGLIQPDQGEVTFDGEPLTRENVNSVRRRLGFVLQDGGLFPHLTARGNVGLVARQLGWSKTKVDSRVTELARLTRLSADVMDRFPHQISGGQKQRVSIIRALMLDPSVILLDEPMGALDPLVRYDLQNDLKEIFQTLHKTVVLVTHDIAEAGFLGDDVVLLREGRVVQQGPLEELIREPAEPFVVDFLRAQRLPEWDETTKV